ncbi:hypothetical protein RDABS01_037932 [Bienertia sinuspersici]
MQRQGVKVSQSTFASVFRSCAGLSALRLGRQLHAHALKTDFGTDIVVATATLDMYAKSQSLLESRKVFNLLPRRSVQSYNAMLVGYGKCGDVVGAQGVFEEMMRRDAVSWNAIIAAYEQNGLEEETLRLFTSMLAGGIEPDDFTYGSVLKASAGKQPSNYGIEIHSRLIKSGMGFHPFVGSTLVDMYCKHGMIGEAMKLHDRLEEQNIVSWNAIISGCLLQNQDEEALRFFSRMLEMGIEPDNFTYATVLDICANLATVGLGKQIHAQIIKHELQADVYIVSTLVDMYSKCGNMQDSQLMFERAKERDFVTWNAMICGYAYHGLPEVALKVFEDMKRVKVKPNHATFIAVLRACGHMGLVEKGWDFFSSMHSYGLDPQLDHYSCMVDMLGKSGQVGKALELIEDMPFEPDDVIWRTLLSVCKMFGNVEIAEKAANSILKLDPEDSSVYILLTNIYANAGMWNEVSRTRKMMRENNVKKEPGCSWIEVTGDVHTFLANEKAHPSCEAIYEELDLLYSELGVITLKLETDFYWNVEIG